MLRKIMFGLHCMFVFQLQSMDPDLLSWNPRILELYDYEETKSFLIDAFKKGDTLAIRFYLSIYEDLKADEEIQNLLQPSDPRNNLPRYIHALNNKKMIKQTMFDTFHQKYSYLKLQIKKALCIA